MTVLTVETQNGILQSVPNTDGGVLIGRNATSKVGFYGTTPVGQSTVTHIGTTTLSQVGTSGKWAFASSTAGKALISQLQSLQTAISAAGLVAKS